MSKLLEIIEGPRVAGDHQNTPQIAVQSEKEIAEQFD